MSRNRFAAANRPLSSTRSVGPYLALGAMAIGAVALIIAWLNAGGAAPARATQIVAPSAQQTQRHEQAVQAFLEQRYAAAYGRFAALADEGHAPSAVMALALVSRGAEVFGGDWSATPGQLQRWSAMVVREVRERAARITDPDRGE